MTDHHTRTSEGPRRSLAWAFGTLSMTAAIGFAAAGCGGSQAATASRPSPTTSAVALSSPEPGAAAPDSGAGAASAGSGASVASSASSATGSEPGQGSASAPASGAGATSHAAVSGANAMIHTCKQETVTQPTQYSLACGDGATSLNKLQWSGWGSPTATATGEYETLVCSPSCAAGKEQTYSATVVLTGLSGGSYTEMTISAPKAETPKVSYSLGSAGPRIKQG